MVEYSMIRVRQVGKPQRVFSVKNPSRIIFWLKMCDLSGLAMSAKTELIYAIKKDGSRVDFI